jgi:ubiquinone/menaquinone biosynthesis C-methylase UbiE
VAAPPRFRRVFTGPADSYDRFMGKYSGRLAPLFCEFARVEPAMRVLDVGCGPGALVAELVRRVGARNVTAVDPAEQFVAAAKARNPGVGIDRASAEELPFPDDEFAAALAQLVVHFMSDPVAGLREMRRVTRRGGGVAACVWDHGGGEGPLSPFWHAVHALDPSAPDESRMAGARRGHLTELFEEAEIEDVEEASLAVSVLHATFEEWWEPFTFGVGPAGAYLAALDAERQNEVREQCRGALGSGPVTITARAWAARGRA